MIHIYLHHMGTFSPALSEKKIIQREKNNTGMMTTIPTMFSNTVQTLFRK